MSHKLYLYSKPVRFWHWFNVIFFLILIVTGISLQYADPNNNMIPFNLAVTWHNIGAFGVIGAFILYLLINRFTLNRRFYALEKGDLSYNLVTQLRQYTYGMFKGRPSPFPVNENRKFNPLQKITYIVVMYFFLPLLILTGLALFFPRLLPTQIFGVSAIMVTAVVHSATGFLLSLFMILHVYLCTVGKTYTTNFKSMITGYHES